MSRRENIPNGGMKALSGRGMLPVDSGSSGKHCSAGIASAHGALYIDKIHTPEMHLCATGSVRLVS